MITFHDFEKIDIHIGRIIKEDLINKLVLCVVNFPPRQIGKFMSEVLTLGVPGPDGAVVLIQPERTVELGGKLY